MLNDNHCIPAGWLQTLVLPPFPEFLFSAYAFVFNAAEQLAIDERINSVILRNNIQTKQIPFSEMLALLQGTIQQTNAELTDAWLSLIANAIDGKKNIQTPSYSFILSQLSLNELLILRHIKKETAVDLR